MFKQQTSPRQPWTKILRWRRVPATELLFFFTNLEVMVRAGTPLADALAALETQITHGYLKEILADVRSELERGQPFSQALKRHPKVFSELVVSMIAVGETGGTLDKILKEIVVHGRSLHALKAKVKSALLYPTVVVTLMAAIGFFMFTYIIPRLTSILRDLNVPLPLATRILIGTGDFFSHYWWIVLIGVVIFIIAFRAFIKTTRGRAAFDALVLKLPITGRLSHQLNLAMSARTLASLLATDVAITTSLEIVAPILGNVHYREALRQTIPGVKSGQPLSILLSTSPKLFPPTFTHMLSVGEKSGTSDEVLAELARFYEGEATGTLDILPTLIEPILIVLLGLGVGAMAVAILLPMYSLTQQL